MQISIYNCDARDPLLSVQLFSCFFLIVTKNKTKQRDKYVTYFDMLDLGRQQRNLLNYRLIFTNYSMISTLYNMYGIKGSIL